MESEKVIRIGTRGSRLALAQTEQVMAALHQQYPRLHIEQVILRTQGDKLLDRPLADFGGKGVFITEFEDALLRGDIDLAVHSAKDMPMELAPGLTIGGVLPRADVRDVLVTRKGLTGTGRITVGTGSLRRQFQLRGLCPEAECISIRGNVPTRLQKVRDGECDGVVLAAAGLERLDLLQDEDFDYRFFSCDEMLPAGGQGIIAIEGRAQDRVTELAGSISDRNALLELETERCVLELLNAGCHEALGVNARAEGGRITLSVIREIRGRIYRQQGSGAAGHGRELAEELVERLGKQEL